MPRDAPLVLITGPSGAVGPAVVREALARGYRVRTLSREPPPHGLLPADVDPRLGDIRDGAAVAHAVAGADYVLHLAAVLHLISAAERADAKYDDVNASATAALVRAAAYAGVERFVLFSTIAVYGENRPGLLNEASPAVPGTPYGMSKLRAEAAVLAQRKPDGTPVGVVLRPAAVYGPRVKGNYRTMLKYLAGRRPVPFRPGANLRTLVFDDDLAAAALCALRHPAAAGQIFNVTDGSTHALEDIVEAMCAALGRSAPAYGLPADPLRRMLNSVGPLATHGPLGTIRSMLEKYSQQIAVDGSLIQRALGFRPAVALDEGWRRTVASLRRAGEL